MKCSIENILSGQLCHQEPVRRAIRKKEPFPVVRASDSSKRITDQAWVQTGLLAEEIRLIKNPHIGAVSASFESSRESSLSITENDGGRTWLTSFWKYQFNRLTFIWFLKQKLGVVNPEALFNQLWISYKQVADSGISNHWLRNWWRSKVQEIEIAKFEKLEHEYAIVAYFQPQMSALQRLWVDVKKVSLAFKNMVWSTAIQHGTSNSYITSAVSKRRNKLPNWNAALEKEIIDEVYSMRSAFFTNQLPLVEERLVSLQTWGNPFKTEKQRIQEIKRLLRKKKIIEAITKSRYPKEKQLITLQLENKTQSV